ncbi:glycosyltransferase family 2 protein [Clostridium perfringens]|nr:glycosyltransferase family 2 protein [Clostridium perfringens]
MNSKVGIVLVNYNGANFQYDCIKTIKNMKYKNYEIIIVDNGSKDDSIKIVRENFDDIVIIETCENNGVAKGNNIGIKEAIKRNCEYVLLLNNDTEVDSSMLTELVKKANENTMVTCKMYYYEPNNMIWCAGGKINWNRATTIHFGEGEVDNGQFDYGKYIEYTPTCCLLIHKNIFQKVGFMDEDYFMYYDDTDFLVRCNKKGIKTWYEPNAKLWHKVSSSSGGALSKISIYYGDRNRLYFIDKYYNKKLKVLTFFYISRYIKWIKNKNIKEISKKAIDDYKNNRMFRQDI